MNEALSNALASATEKLLEDDALADALEGKSATPVKPGAAPAATKPAASGYVL